MVASRMVSDGTSDRSRITEVLPRISMHARRLPPRMERRRFTYSQATTHRPLHCWDVPAWKIFSPNRCFNHYPTHHAIWRPKSLFSSILSFATSMLHAPTSSKRCIMQFEIKGLFENIERSALSFLENLNPSVSLSSSTAQRASLPTSPIKACPFADSISLLHLTTVLQDEEWNNSSLGMYFDDEHLHLRSRPGIEKEKGGSPHTSRYV